MALVLGTNCGFVASAPVADPNGNQAQTIDFQIQALKHTAPVSATAITEIGWYTGDATEEANFEVGLYSDAGAGEPELRLQVSATNAKGTTAGWKVVTGLNWAITAGTAYWLAVQLDNTATQTTIDEQTTGGAGTATLQVPQDTLPADWGTSSLTNASRSFAIYAVYTAGAASGNPWYQRLHNSGRF